MSRATPPDEPSLRQRVLRGGAALVVREGVGLAVRFVGVLVLMRLLGPTQFGEYAGAAAMIVVLTVLAEVGTDVHLPRLEVEPTEREYDQAFTVLVIASVGLAAAVFALSFPLVSLFPAPGFVAPTRVLLLAVPLTALCTPARTKLERRFDWNRVAVLEVGGDIVLYTVSVTLAALGAGVWAPVAGFIAWQASSLLAVHVLAGYLPRLRWSTKMARTLVGVSARSSTASLLTRAEDLVNPLVVGRLLGPEAVGIIAFSLRLGDNLAFPARASWRLMLVALGRVKSDMERFRRGLEESMAVQVLLLAPLFAALCISGPVVIPAVFGDRWEPATALLPFVAVRFVVAAVNSAQISGLYVIGREADVVRLTAVRLTAATAGALIFVPLWGLKGFGAAMLAPAVSFLAIREVMGRRLEVSYAEPLLWGLAFVPLCFAPLAGLPVGLALGLTAVPVFASTLARRRLADYRAHLLGALR